MNPPKTQTSVGMETVDETVKRAKAMLKPTVSANEIANPPANVQPPIPGVSTNDGSRTNNLVNNVATNTQNFITSESEAAQKRDELAGLLGNQTFDASGQRTQLGEQYGLPANLARLTDIQTQLAQANTASGVTKTRIEGAAGQTLGQAQRRLHKKTEKMLCVQRGLPQKAPSFKVQLKPPVLS